MSVPLGLQLVTNRYWMDVFATPTGIAWVYVTGSGPLNTWKTVTLEVNGVVVFTGAAPQPPQWIRGAADPAGNIQLAARGGDDFALLLCDGSGTWTTNGSCYTFAPSERHVAVGWNGAAFIVIAQDTATSYRRLVIGTGEAAGAIGFSTSQGILQMTAGAALGSDVLVWTQPNRTSSPFGGVTFTLPIVVNGVIFGAGSPTPGATVYLASTSSIALLNALVPYDPRLAFVNGVWACASFGNPGDVTTATTIAGLLFVGPPWSNLTPPTPPPNSPNPPVPPPTGLPGGGGIIGAGILTNSARARILEAGEPRLYHETDRIADPHTQRATRLLWDRVYDVGAQMQAVDQSVGNFEARIAALETQVEATRLVAEGAAITAGKVTSQQTTGTPIGSPTPSPSPAPSPSPSPSPSPAPSPTPTDPNTPPPDPTQPPVPPDLGTLNSGIATSGPTGHVTAGQALTLTLAGQVIGGTVKEFPALTAPAANLVDRGIQVDTLVGRIMWHLGLAGFTVATNLYELTPGAGYISQSGSIWLSINGTGVAYALFDFNSQYVNYASALALAPASVFPVQGYPGGIAD